MIYLDDILIYSSSLHKHQGHIKIILEQLRETSFYLDMTKCEFHITEVPYLRFIISTRGVKIDLAKIKTIVE